MKYLGRMFGHAIYVDPMIPRNIGAVFISGVPVPNEPGVCHCVLRDGHNYYERVLNGGHRLLVCRGCDGLVESPFEPRLGNEKKAQPKPLFYPEVVKVSKVEAWNGNNKQFCCEIAPEHRCRFEGPSLLFNAKRVFVETTDGAFLESDSFSLVDSKDAQRVRALTTLVRLLDTERRSESDSVASARRHAATLGIKI